MKTIQNGQRPANRARRGSLLGMLIALLAERGRVGA